MTLPRDDAFINKKPRARARWTQMRREHETRNSLTGSITIRRLTSSEADATAVQRLAERDSREPLSGGVLIVEVEGRMLAAMSLADGRTIADPFSRTAELRSLLELRAKQLRHRARPTRRRVRTHARARASLAGSPPGAGGRLLELSR